VRRGRLLRLTSYRADDERTTGREVGALASYPVANFARRTWARASQACRFGGSFARVVDHRLHHLGIAFHGHNDGSLFDPILGSRHDRDHLTAIG
jgi:hypothetical protein